MLPFVQIPMALVRDANGRFKGVSGNSKIVYGMLLSRTALSMKNGWIDEKNDVYIIYSVEDLMEDMGCSKPTAVKYLQELEQSGLITKKKQGLGRPNLIYVQELYFEEASGEKNTLLQEVKKPLPQEVKDLLPQEVKEPLLQEVKKPLPLEVKNPLPRDKYTEIDRNIDKTISPINQSIDIKAARACEGRDGWMDGPYDLNGFCSEESIRQQIGYDWLVQAYSGDADIIDEIVGIMYDLLNSKKNEQHIGAERWPSNIVRTRLNSLRPEHIEMVLSKLHEPNFKKVSNVKGYLTTMLYNAPLSTAVGRALNG